MEFAEIRTNPQNPRYFLGAMDARTVAKAAGIEVNSLNVWVHRDLIPGMPVGTQGRRRDFDLNTAIGVAIIAELVRFGLSVKQAACFATWEKPPAPFSRRLLVIPEWVKGGPLAIGYPSNELLFDTIRSLPHMLGEPPSIYCVIDVECLAQRMKQAEEEWERQLNEKVA